MSEPKPTDRINIELDDLRSLIDDVASKFGIGKVNDYSIIGVGYEDCNVIIETKSTKYVAKLFAKTRKEEDIARYVTILEKVVDSGVNHPKLLQTDSGELILKSHNVSLVLMNFIEGETFLAMDRAPNDLERKAVLKQASLVNLIDYKPKYIFDSWAIPNIQKMYGLVKRFLSPADVDLVNQAIQAYRAVPIDSLPHCLVHGDLTKANVIKDTKGDVYILDFACANYYPRIQELAVIVANLMYDPTQNLSLDEMSKLAADEYSEFNPLTDLERQHLPAYALAGVTMEFLGPHREKFVNNIDSWETNYWLKLGREGLQRELT